jgi:tetratricopeptide (TPR) repeat protein
MSDTNDEKVSCLLQEGLELYGTGDIARAFLLWNEALEIDPSNEEALDYIRDADRRSKPRSGSAGVGKHSVIDDARRLLRAEDAEAALELLMSASATNNLECEAMVELLRATLFRRYQAELGDLAKVPCRVEHSDSDLRSRNLPPRAGFLLSMIDGQTSLGDLVSVSGMDRFDAMRSLHQMLEAGIVEWQL